MDFGIAARVEAPSMMEKPSLGTAVLHVLRVLASRKSVSGRVFSAGLVFYELLRGSVR